MLEYNIQKVLPRGLAKKFEIKFFILFQPVTQPKGLLQANLA
jgi:hypothetical protein